MQLTTCGPLLARWIRRRLVAQISVLRKHNLTRVRAADRESDSPLPYVASPSALGRGAVIASPIDRRF